MQRCVVQCRLGFAEGSSSLIVGTWTRKGPRVERLAGTLVQLGPPALDGARPLRPSSTSLQGGLDTRQG